MIAAAKKDKSPFKKPKLTKKARRKLASVPVRLPSPWARVSDTLVGKSAIKGMGELVFGLPEPAPGVLPKNQTAKKIARAAGRGMAMDSQVIETNAWAAQQVYNGAFFNGVTFLGYTYLSELAQRPEYRRLSEVLATECTRKWIVLKSASGDNESKAERIKELQAELIRLDVRGAFRKMVELDGFMGRSHLYLDTGSTDDRDELVKSIGDGSDAATKMKFAGQKGFLRAVKPVEPVWCYPAKYNANDPLKPDWYNPQSWFAQGKEIHCTRLLTFVGREVPDLLKPSYQFGGLSLSQMAKPYVDNWLRTRQSVADLVWSFSVRGLKTDIGALNAEDGDQFIKRMQIFSNTQTNQGLMMIDKDTEEFFNITTPLGSLDALQAQSQEHMCSVTGTPVIKLLGIQPAGLNASSQGEMDTWRDWVLAFQEKFFGRKLTSVIHFVQMSLWGEIDDDITHEFVPLEELNEAEEASKNKTEADEDAVRIDSSVLSPADCRKALSENPNSRYHGIKVDDLPEAPEDLLDEEEGMMPNLGTPEGQLGSMLTRDPDDVENRTSRDTRSDRIAGERRDINSRVRTRVRAPRPRDTDAS